MGGRGDSSRRLWAAAFIGLLGLVLAIALALPSARVPLREPFVSKPTRGAAAAIPLEARESRKRTHVHRLTLSVVEPSVLRDHEELQLMFSSVPAPAAWCTRAARPRRALPARSRVRGELVDGEPVAFRRSGTCSGLLGSAELDLTVELAGEGTLALLGFEPLAGSAPGPIQVPARAAGAGPYDVRGAFVDYTAPAPRIELLNHMWRIRPGTAWLWLSLAAGVALAVVGCLIFRHARSRRRAANGAFARDLGGRCRAPGRQPGRPLCGLVPPLMGPDEPYHLLGFAELASDRALAEDTVVWMGETHLWRIRYQPTERFRTIDVGRPYVAEDEQLRATEVAMRSAVLARLSEAVAPLLRGEPRPASC